MESSNHPTGATGGKRRNASIPGVVVLENQCPFSINGPKNPSLSGVGQQRCMPTPASH